MARGAEGGNSDQANVGSMLVGEQQIAASQTNEADASFVKVAPAGGTDASGSNSQAADNCKDADQVPVASEAEQPLLSYFSLFRFADGMDKLLMLAGFVGAAMNGAAMPVFTIIFGNLINNIGSNQDVASELRHQTAQDAVWFVCIGVGAALGSFMQFACWTLTGVRQVNKVRYQYLKAVLQQEVAYFDVSASGRLLQGLNEDAQTVQEAIGSKAGVVIANLTTAVVGITLAFVRGWQMTLVILAVIPVLLIVIVIISMFYLRFTTAINNANANATYVAQQALGNVRTVYAFNGEPRTLEAYSSVLDEPRKMGVKQGVFIGFIIGVVNCFIYFSYALAMWFGSTRIINGSYTGGEVLSVLIAALIGGFALGQAAPNIQNLQQGRTAGGRIFAVLGRQPGIDVDAPGDEPKHVEGHVEFRDVSFAYPARPDIKVFQSFCLDVPAGWTVALVGESGSGKSTAVSLAERFYDPQEGAVLLDGVDLRCLQLRWLRAQVGLVSQEPTLFGTTIAENIALGRPGASRADVEAAATAANAHRFISALPKGYETHVGEKGVHMSGGQKQRIAIARAILKNPRVLLLDEATSALDAQSEHVVQAALDGLMAGRTTIVVAHRLSTVIEANKICVVRSGQVVEEGTHSQLMEQGGAYKVLVQMQQARGAVEADDIEENEKGVDEGTVLQLDKPSTSVDKDGVSSTGSFQSLQRQSPNISGVPEGLPGAAASAHAAASVGCFPALRRKKLKLKPDDKTDVDLRKLNQEETAKSVPLSRLAELNKPELPYAFGGLLGSVVLGLTMPAFAYAFSSLIAVFYAPTEDELRSGVRTWCLVFVGIGLGTAVAAVLQSYCFNVMGQHLAMRVRVLMMKALLRQEVGWFDQERNSSGVLVSKLSSDAAAVKGQYGDTMGLITQNLTMGAACLGIAFSNNWRLALVILGGVPFLVASALIQTTIIAKSSSKEDDLYARSNQTASEAITNIRTVAAYGMEGQVSTLFEEKLKQPTVHAVRRANMGGLGYAFSLFCVFSMYALAFWYAGILVSNGDDFKGVLMAFFAIFLGAMGAAQAQIYYPDVAKGKAATQRVFSIVDRKPQIDASSEEGAQPLTCTGALELRDITFAYPQRVEVKVFHRFNLTVSAGHTVALVGESGSGKSTVVALIERFYDPQAGAVLLDGQDIRTLNLRWLRDRIGLVGQEPVLFDMTIEENIKYGRPDASRDEVEAAARAANADSFIFNLPEGYATRIGAGSSQLSGGQKQRVAIARALVKDPRILLLDEATSALDAESEAVVQEALDRLMVGRTTVVVAHRLSTVRNADTIAVVWHGRILEQGKHEELMAKPNGSYARLVRHQVTGHA